MPFNFQPCKDLPEVVLIEPTVHADDRGWFMELHKRSEFNEHGITSPFVQDNCALSNVKGTLRGLHFQKAPAAQGKLVTCLVGEVFDVAVDIRIGSPTYRLWVSANLTSENHHMLWVPEGFAHGYLTLAKVTLVAYKVTAEYSPQHDRGVRWNDPTIGIKWPIPHPTLSKKDRDAPLLDDADNNLEWNQHA